MLIREDPIDVVNRSRQTVPAASYRKGHAMERFKSQPLDPSMLVSRDWPYRLPSGRGGSGRSIPAVGNGAELVSCASHTCRCR